LMAWTEEAKMMKVSVASVVRNVDLSVEI